MGQQPCLNGVAHTQSRKWLSANERELKSKEKRLLLKYGAERGFKDRWGHTAEQEAVFHQHTGPLLELLKQP